jgi:putative colanic acid biosynthesis UDP-glucose lipid carrier transferase
MISQSSGRRSILQRRSSTSNTLQAVLDGLAVTGVSWWLIVHQIGYLSPIYVIMLLMLLGALAVVYDHYAIYRTNVGLTLKAFRLFKAWTAAFAFLVAMAFLTKQSEQYSRILVTQIFFAGFTAQLLLHVAMRTAQKKILKHSTQAENVLIIGSGRLASFLYRKISDNPWLGETVVGCVLIKAEDAALLQVTEGEKGLPVLGNLAELDTFIERYSIKSVYFVTPLDASEVFEDVYFGLLDKHIAVHWVPDIFSLRLINHSVREIAGIPVLTLSETPLTGMRLFLKRAEDLLLASAALILSAPLLLAVAIAIKLDSPGPVFFRQQRMGWNGEIFRIWKFRSMVVHPLEDDVVKQAERNDPRVTRVGGFIRRTSLDELPQLFNVLMGEMSLVGPRPHAIQHDEEYSRRITDYFARRNIKPGITGLAQVRGFRGETRDLEQMIQRVESDIEYINNWSLWLDFVILLRTVSALAGKQAY